MTQPTLGMTPTQAALLDVTPCHPLCCAPLSLTPAFGSAHFGKRWQGAREPAGEVKPQPFTALGSLVSLRDGHCASLSPGLCPVAQRGSFHFLRSFFLCVSFWLVSVAAFSIFKFIDLSSSSSHLPSVPSSVCFIPDIVVFISRSSAWVLFVSCRYLPT